MMGPLQNAMRLQALRAVSDQASTRVGIVRNFDPSIWAVRAELQPEGVLSGWLPVASPWIGNAWGMLAAPSLGDMVAVHFFGDDFEAGYVEGRMFNDVDRPLPVQAGEFWLMHASGAFFKLTNDGAAIFSDGHGAAVTLNGDGSITSTASSWAHTGDVSITGTLTASADVVGGGKSLKTHVHGGVSRGGSSTNTPT